MKPLLNESALNDFLIVPTWSAPAHIVAFSTTRQGGVSLPPYSSLNLGLHVSDHRVNVEKNRALLPYADALTWLEQTHSDTVIYCPSVSNTPQQADGAWTDLPLIGCCVLTADCLPVLITNHNGSFVAAVHCGWRGLAKGILEKTLDQIGHPPEDCLVWFGPAIGANAFEVGSEVLAFFSKSEQQAFRPSAIKPNKWLGNLYLLAKLKLNERGVTQIFGGDYCTHSQSEQFYSYRRDGQTGRMATCILMDD